MNRRQLIGTIGFAGVMRAATAGDRFIGVWRLISCGRKLKDGRIDYPYGETPVGRISYDKAGRMSAQLMRPYHFYSNRLLLTAASTLGSTELVWEREPD